jgi:uncharacterized RDD family membrane protein YckC
MENRQTPLNLFGIFDNIYAGFWIRFGSLILDFIFILPVTILNLYLNSLGKNIYFFTIIPTFLFGLWYNIYLPKRFGGTPGKLLIGIKILRIDGLQINWKEAILRHIVLLLFTFLNITLTIYCVLKADNSTYLSLSWIKKSHYLTSFSPLLFKIYIWSTNIWTYSELLVLSTNKRKRAIHDYIAGTVIVKEKYIDKIRESMFIINENNASN